MCSSFTSAFPQHRQHGITIPSLVHSSCACLSPIKARRSRLVTLFTAFSRNQRIKQRRAFSAYHTTWCKNLPTTLANRLWWLTHGSCPLSNLIYHVVCQLFCSLVKRRFACFCDLIQLLRIYSSAYNIHHRTSFSSSGRHSMCFRIDGHPVEAAIRQPLGHFLRPADGCSSLHCIHLFSPTFSNLVRSPATSYLQFTFSCR